MEAVFFKYTNVHKVFLTPVIFAILDCIAEKFLGYWSSPFEISNFTEIS